MSAAEDALVPKAHTIGGRTGGARVMLARAGSLPTFGRSADVTRGDMLALDISAPQ